jgi:hypothetical protein
MDIAMPNTLKTGANIKQMFKKSKLNDPDWKETWVTKYAYSYVFLIVTRETVSNLFIGWISYGPYSMPTAWINRIF